MYFATLFHNICITSLETCLLQRPSLTYLERWFLEGDTVLLYLYSCDYPFLVLFVNKCMTLVSFPSSRAGTVSTKLVCFTRFTPEINQLPSVHPPDALPLSSSTVDARMIETMQKMICEEVSIGG